MQTVPGNPAQPVVTDADEPDEADATITCDECESELDSSDAVFCESCRDNAITCGECGEVILALDAVCESCREDELARMILDVDRGIFTFAELVDWVRDAARTEPT